MDEKPTAPLKETMIKKGKKEKNRQPRLHK
jgi:hypothetical protein